MMQNRFSSTILILLGIVLAVSIAFLLYTRYSYQGGIDTMTAFNEKYEEGKILQGSGDYTKAVDVFTGILKDVPEKRDEGYLKIFIAGNLFLRNEGDDQAKSIQTYKEVLNDPEMPAYVKAKVLTDLAGIVNKKDESFYRAYFSEKPFSDFLPASGTSGSKMSAVYLKMLQLSDETFPNSNAEYLIAGNYYTPLLVNNTLPGSTTPQQAAKIIQEYVKKADLLAPSDESSYKPQIVVQRYFFRALAMNASSRILENISTTEREAAFKLALEKGMPYENTSDYPTIAAVMKTRFYYANFLMEFFGKDRYPEIVTVLQPFGKASSGSDQSFKLTRAAFITSVAMKPSSDFVRTRALSLAKISPEFSQFLTSLGVTQ